MIFIFIISVINDIISANTTFSIYGGSFFMSENGKGMKEETFTVCPNNQGLLVSREGIIKDINTNKVIEQFLSDNGYLQIKNPMRHDKNPRINEYVHRIVALTYVPEYSYVRWICHHKDNDRRNNSPENLLWSSPETHRKLHGYSSFRMSA
jgi:hypothetical protein